MVYTLIIDDAGIDKYCKVGDQYIPAKLSMTREFWLQFVTLESYLIPSDSKIFHSLHMISFFKKKKKTKLSNATFFPRAASLL